MTQKNILKRAVKTITTELIRRIDYFRDENKLIEAQRIEERTNFDLEMMQELGYCNGIENYSRHLTQRVPGEPPPTLLDYFSNDFLMFIDESHIAVPQIRAMYKGDRSRKRTRVGYGFRLPSAQDNRPLTFEEFESKISQVVYVSATPSDYEITEAKNELVEQIVTADLKEQTFFGSKPQCTRKHVHRWNYLLPTANIKLRAATLPATVPSPPAHFEATTQRNSISRNVCQISTSSITSIQSMPVESQSKEIVALEDLPIAPCVHLGVERRSDSFANRLRGGPEVLEIDGLSVLVMTQRLADQVDVDPAG